MDCLICGKPLQDVTFTGTRDGSQVFDSAMMHMEGVAGCHTLHPTVPNTVYLADCISGMRQMDSESVDLIVTDPPYLINYATGQRKDKSHDFCKPIQGDTDRSLIENYLAECYRILKQDHAVYMFCSSKTLDFFKKAAQDAGFTLRNTIIWVKNNWTAGDLKAQFGQQYEPVLLLNKGRAFFNGTRCTDVWTFPRVAGKNQLHQNQKPVELISQCIEKHSNVGDVVFDGFMGSGTTAVAAKALGRRYIGFEIEPRYFWITHNRLCGGGER